MRRCLTAEGSRVVEWFAGVHLPWTPFLIVTQQQSRCICHIGRDNDRVWTVDRSYRVYTHGDGPGDRAVESELFLTFTIDRVESSGRVTGRRECDHGSAGTRTFPEPLRNPRAPPPPLVPSCSVVHDLMFRLVPSGRPVA